MNRYLTLILPVLLAGCCCSRNVSAVTDTTLPVEEKITPVVLTQTAIANELLSVTTIPEAMGSINNVILREGEHPLLWGAYFENAVIGDLLTRPDLRGCPTQERFWGNNTGTECGVKPMRVAAKTADMIEFHTPAYGDTSYEVTRRLSLAPGTSAVDVEVTVTSHYDKARTLRPWIDILPRPGGIVRSIPVKGGTRYTAIGGGVEVPADGIYDCRGDWNNFLAPHNGWIAARLEAEDVMIAILPRPEPLDDCAFYCWNGVSVFCRDGVMKRESAHTIEMILGARMIAPGKTLTYRYRIAVFPGLKRLLGCSHDFGVDARRGKRFVELKISALAPVKKAGISLQLERDGKVVATLPEKFSDLGPDQVRTLRFAIPAGTDAAQCRIFAVVGRTRIELLEPEKKK